MQVIVALILLVSVVFGREDFLREFHGNELKQVTEINHSAKIFEWVIPRGVAYTIGKYAFNGTDIRNIIVKGREYFRYGRATHPSKSSLSIQEDSFTGIPKLQVLKLFYVKVNFNNQNPLAPLGSLNELALQYTHLTEVPRRTLTSVPRLQWLNLKGNNISTIYSDSFYLLESLQNLDLSCNGISDIESGAFRGLTKLKHLQLSHNNITITPNIFQGTPELINLNLEKAFNPNETQLKPGMFDGLNRLTDLILKGNNFESIPMGMFDDLISLKNLDLSSNNIETMAQFSNRELSFGKLYLHENRINVIKRYSFFNLKVDHLRLDHNNIQQVNPGAFDGLTVEGLDLSANNLTNIGEADFARCRARRLDLSSNRIESIAEGASICGVSKELRIDATLAEEVRKFRSGLRSNDGLKLVQNGTLLE